MKKTIFRGGYILLTGLLLILLLLQSPQAEAAEITASGTCGAQGDNLTWTLDDEGTLTISGTGMMPSMYDPGVDNPWSQYSASIKMVYIDSGVTSISSSAFGYCRNLSFVTISDTVNKIGNGAFMNCSSLTAISVDENNTTFRSENGAILSKDGTTLLLVPSGLSESFTIPDGVSRIESYAFWYCENLTAITLPVSVVSIGYDAFSLDDYTLSRVYYMGSRSQKGAIVIEERNDAIRYASWAYFLPGDNLTWILDSEGTLTISGTGDMDSFNSSIGYDIATPWHDVQATIKRVVISEGVTSIGYGAFTGCANLTDITIPSTVSNINQDGIRGCLRVDEGNTVYSSDDYGVLFNKDKTQLIYVPKTLSGSYAIPNEVTEINGMAFSGSSLQTIVIPIGVTIIPYYGFSNCINLSNIIIPDGVTVIDNGAFYGCTNLQGVSLPDSVAVINYGAFDSCESLTDVYYAGTLEQRGAIYFGDFNFSLVTATWHYSTMAGGSCGDDLFWTLTTDGAMTISGTGDMYHYDNEQIEQRPWHRLSAQIKTAELSTGITGIGGHAFYGCNELTSINIPEGVTSICETSFYGCSALAEVNLPASVKELSVYPFYGCGAQIWVSDSNPYFSSDSCGAVLSKDGTILYRIPEQSGKYVIPDGVTKIWPQAFANGSGLSSLVIPESLASIEDSLHACASLTDVYYAGSEEQKAQIYICDPAEEVLGRATWHYSYATATLDFSSASVVLQNTLTIHFKVDSSLFGGNSYQDPYVVFEFGGVRSSATSYTVQDGKYVFAFNNIAPHQMDRAVTATLYATKGNTLCQGETINYSVKDYCYRMLETCSPENDQENKYAKLRTLLVDLLRYGAASQRFTGATAGFVDATLTEAQLTWGTSGDPTLTSVLNIVYKTVPAPTVSWQGAGLSLQDSVVVRIKFAAASTEGLTVKITVDGKEYEIGADRFVPTAREGVYYLYFNKLYATDMRTPLYFTAYQDGIAVSDTLCYSVESYAFTYQNNANTQLAELVKAIIRYGDAAYEFVN